MTDIINVHKIIYTTSNYSLHEGQFAKSKLDCTTVLEVLTVHSALQGDQKQYFKNGILYLLDPI